MRLTLCLILATSTFWGCRTTEDDSATNEMPPGALGLPALPGVVIAYVDGPSAKTMYNAFHVEESVNNGSGRKSYEGNSYVYCTRSGGGGHIPNGAQGIVAPQVHNCRMGVPFNPPPGAQGMPAQPFMTLEGDAARDFFNAFTAAPTTSNQALQKSWQGKGTFDCYFSESTYACSVRDLNGPVVPPPPSTPVVKLSGKSAETAYKKFKAAESNSGNGKQKVYEGNAKIACSREGGSIPNGAQGMPAAASFSCSMGVFQSGPHVGLAAPLLVLTGAAARDFWNGFDEPELSLHHGTGATKVYENCPKFRCAYKKGPGNKRTYTCEGSRGNAGGPPPGAQGLPQP